MQYAGSWVNVEVSFRQEGGQSPDCPQNWTVLSIYGEDLAMSFAQSQRE